MVVTNRIGSLNCRMFRLLKYEDSVAYKHTIYRQRKQIGGWVLTALKLLIDDEGVGFSVSLKLSSESVSLLAAAERVA